MPNYANIVQLVSTYTVIVYIYFNEQLMLNSIQIQSILNLIFIFLIFFFNII